jgi:PAS domain S-box-containing protein
MFSEQEGTLSIALDTAPSEIDRIVSELPNGFATFDRQWRYTYANNRLLTIFHKSRAEVLGKQAWEVFPHRVGVEFFDLIQQAMTERIEVQFEFYYELVDCWVEHRLYPTADGLALLMTDIGERKQAEARLQCAAELDAFRVKLSDMLRSLADPIEIQVAACRLLGEQSSVDRAYYVEVNQSAQYVRVERNYLRGNSPSMAIVGTLWWTDYGWTLPLLERGEIIIVENVEDSDIIPAADRAAMAAVRIAAHITLPVIREGKLIGALCVTESTPRQWSAIEVELVKETAERIWEAIERARAEAALRESEENYRSLFTSIDEGFCIVEAIFDAAQQPIDYRFLQVNPAFFRLTGLPADAVGKTARELVPDLERFWVETYGDVALTGESVRFEHESIPMNRWFDVYASRIGDATSRRVAIVFDNITERKQAEQIARFAARLDAVRIALTDALRPLADPVEIQATANRILGENLGANRVVYFEVRGANYVVECDYVNGVMPLYGNYPIDSFGEKLLAVYRSGRTVCDADLAADLDLSAAEKSGYAALQIGAHIAVPLIEGGEVVAGLAVHTAKPRAWTQEEVSLVEEVAERTRSAIDRALTEAALRESEEKYRSLFDSMNDGFCIVELLDDERQQPIDYRFLAANAAFERQTGLSHPIGKTGLDFAPNLEPEILANYHRVVVTGESIEFEIAVADLGRCFRVSANRHGKPQQRQVAILSNDITDRQRQEANLAILAEITGDLAGLTDIDATMNRLGETIVRHFGATQCVFGEFAEDLETGTISHGWHIEGALSLFGTYRMEDFISDELIWTGAPLVVNDTQTDRRVNAANYAALGIGSFILVPLVRKGQWRFLLPLVDSKPREWRDDEVDLLREIADRLWARLERARAEEALRDREEKLQLATAASRVGLWFWDLETNHLMWTEQCKALFGLSAATEMSYTIFLAALHPEDRDRAHAAVTQAIADRTEYDVEYRTCWQDGTIHWIAAKGSCTYDSTDKPIRMMGVALDISDRKQAEIALAERNQELDSFVYIVSHDLKAPLRAIANLSEWIEQDLGTELGSGIQQQMSLLRDRVRRMEAIVDGLLQYARIGRTDVQSQLVSVTELLAETIDSLSPPPTFEIVIAPDLPTFYTKRLLLSQVFANLISNAFKHHDRPDGRIQISCQSHSDVYEFAIADDGPGIPLEQHDRVFIIFQSTTAQKKPDSTGIGLSIVKKIVETARGRIWLESELGRGTTFYFTWPKGSVGK